MQMLNSSSSPNEHPMEKVIRWGVPLGLIGLGVMFINPIIGFMTKTFNGLTGLFSSVIGAAATGAAALVVLLAVGLPILWVIQHPDFVSMWWKAVSRKILEGFVKLDPLSFMDAFVDKLTEKLKNLRIVKTILEGKKLKLERKIQQLMKAVDGNMKRAQAAQAQGKKDMAVMLSRKAAGDAESVKLYKPMYDRMVKYLTFFEKLDENWSLSIEGTKYEVERKREEYEVIKEMHKGLSAAEIFTNTDNEQVQIFQMSVKALEESVTQKIAYIDDFEKRSKSMMEGIDIDKQMMNDEGLRMLEQYEANGGAIFFDTQKTVDGKVTIVATTPIQKNTSAFAKLLK